jgi:hypothetical protein
MGLMIQAVSCTKVSTTGSNFQPDTTVGAIYSFARLAGKDAAFTKHSAGSYGSPHGCSRSRSLPLSTEQVPQSTL